jgi:hypothetical protein
VALELVVDEAGAGHRLDRRRDRLAVAGEAAGKRCQPVGVRRGGARCYALSVRIEDVIVEPLAA